MSDKNTTLLNTWLKLLSGMVPGMSQAVLLLDVSKGVDTSESKGNSKLCWPESVDTHSDLMTVAKLSASQNKNVTTTLSSHGNDEVIDTVIAIPLNEKTGLDATLAVLVNVKPSQQSVVMQILRWGEDWLSLLLQQEVVSNSAVNKTASTSTDIGINETKQSLGKSAHKVSFLQSMRSRIIAVSALLLVIILFVFSGTYRVSAPASLEGRIQRAIVAPFDGYIASAFYRAGETVKRDDLIAEMDSQSLILEQQRYLAEKNEYTRQYRQALSTRDKSQAHIYKSQVKQAEAQLQLLDVKIQRSTIVSPLEGVIISGDLSRSLGAPVKTGDVLFEVAPLDEYRLVISVNEKQVADVKSGMSGVLTLSSMPETKLEFDVHKVSPVFEEGSDGIEYRVEATFAKKYPALRPGMQGVAKIEIEQRRLAWIYLHELYDAVRLWFWSWMP